MGFSEKVGQQIRTDETLRRARAYGKRGARSLPRAAGYYLLEKAPVVQWLPRYKPKWLINDVIAGLTVGIMLIPQSLAYAKIATIPGEFGLMSSWLPALLYVIMGTSKDLSTGPTSIMGLLTAEIIHDTEGDYTPQQVASAIALMVGVYSFAIGALKLGFILDYVSIPVLTGFISAAAIVIMLGQIPSLFGAFTVRTGTVNILHDFFSQLGKSEGPTIGVGFGGIILLVAMQWAGKRWGKKHKFFWILSISRSALVLVIFTGLSYGLNKNRKTPVFAISKVQGKGIATPKLPDSTLISKVASRAISPLLAAALEHLAIAKGFGRKNNYVIDQSQELCYLGLTNFLNSFFSSMTVGGAMSRTAVNSESGVKSPLNGIVTGGFVLIAIYFLTGTLYWIPKATLAAIIVTAVWHLVGPSSLFYHFWRTSLADFIASMVAFWVTLFVSTEYGILAAAGFSVAYTLVKSAFARVRLVDEEAIPTIRRDVFTPSATIGDEISSPTSSMRRIPSDTKIFRFEEAILFPNAYRVKNSIYDTILTYNAGSAAAAAKAASERNWSVSGEMRVKELRKRAGVNATELPSFRYLVLDMSNVTYIDTTGITALNDLKTDVRKFAGSDAEVRFIGMDDRLKNKFGRAGWTLVDAESVERGVGTNGADVVYESLNRAIWENRRSHGEIESTHVHVGSEKV